MSVPDNKPKLDSQAYITLAYLCTVAVGMMFDYKYYDHFSINIFEYSDILDFLLAPVKNLELILFVIVTIILVWIFFRLDKLWQDKAPKSYKRFNFGWSKDVVQRYRPYFFTFSLIGYLFLAASFYGDRTYERFQESPKSIELIFESGNTTIKGNLIGKNSDYIFMQAADSTIKAVPVNSDVQEIIIARPGSGN